MSLTSMKSAIDDFLLRSAKECHIVFYGGEPLMAIDVIKEAVEYVKNTITNKHVQFSIITNGTLLTEENVLFLINNNFYLQVSLDGPCEIHNRNRVIKG